MTDLPAYKEPVTGIRVYEDAIPRCDELIAWVEEQPYWEPSMVTSPTGENVQIADYRDSDMLVVPPLSFDVPELWSQTSKIVWNAMRDYAKEWVFDFQYIAPVSVNRYAPGQKFAEHADAMPGSNRMVSALIYLNTLEDGSGSTEFTRMGLTLLPVQGRLVVFPPNYIYRHIAHPPTETKYSMAFWGMAA